ncbi:MULTISPECIES: DUF3892 domain-containing protein [Clostridium]|uniref:Uncharacterized protein n=2 Tax=Clostridium TaxID=1485 RepID=A0A151APB1_9CLOT|nr:MULTISPECIES: DUF3892 domain-containing protein [Clostridium]KYH29227.1 hypothetical protein CLCOL_09600 [Clostridium colicanis DSM 13634]MBE6042923.1 hypothetical protein [Clostridium thermopalmarium]PRR71058.1 hypothetical protein CPAL_21580 [Clostridium thermopalmarium DSM 5974]PVZ23603.1 hypothetical protein LX19_01501 [Clostridium thermopalmarium DSM 5974]
MYIDFTFAHVITDLVKGPDNNITGYRLENGDVISKGEAIDLSKQGAIKGISEEVYKQKDEFLKSIPHEEFSNILELPVIKDYD